MSTMASLNNSMNSPEPGASPSQGPVQTQRSLDPRSSLSDYNRVMLEYTQRRMSTFVDPDDGNGSPLSRSSRDSNSTANSNTNSNSSGSCNGVASPSSGVSSRQGDGIAHKDFAVSEHDADATTTSSSKSRF